MASKVPWSSFQPTGQAVGHAQPTVGQSTSTAARASPKPAHWIHWIPATILQDAIIYTHGGARRAWGRVVVILLAIIALGILTAGRYLTSDDLISSKVIVRDTRTNLFSESSAHVGTCPCKEQNIKWSRFVVWKPDIAAMIYNSSSSNSVLTFRHAFCNNVAVHKSAKSPTPEQISNEGNRVYFGYFTGETFEKFSNDTLKVMNHYGIFSTHEMCMDMLLGFQTDLDSSRGRAQMATPSLMTKDSINSSYYGYLADLIERHHQTWQSSYRSIFVINNAITADYECTLKYAKDCPVINLPAIHALLNTTTDAAAFIKTSYAARDAALAVSGSLDNYPARDLILQFMLEATDIKYSSYQSGCAPRYCDFARNKTVFNWVSEFLSTVGGLWTVVIGTAALCWGLIGILGVTGNESSAFYAWH